MKKLYSLVIALLVLAAVSSEVARAQTYTINSYIVHKIDTPDPQGLGSGPNWQSISALSGATNDQTGELPYYGPVYEDEFCGYGHVLPFNVRYGNTQLTTTNTFTITTCGAVILDPNWGATWLEEPLIGYNFIEMEPESNSATYYNYAYPEADENGLESEGSYGLFPNYVLMPFSLGYDYNYIPSETSNPTSFHYITLGTAPNRELVVETDNMYPYQGNADGFNTSVSYQVVIYEAGISQFQFNYSPMNGSNPFGYARTYQGCPVSIGSGGSQFTFPGTWNYVAYVANEGSYLLIEDYGACVGMKMGANQYIQIDFGGNGWNANNQFAVGYNTPYGTNGWPLLPDTAAKLPLSSIRFLIAYPYDFAATAINIPLNEQPYTLNTPFTPTLTLTNGGSAVPTSLQLSFTMYEIGVGQVYNQTVTLPNAANPTLPGPFSSKTITLPNYTPGVSSLLPAGDGNGGYGIYEDTMIVFNLLPTADQNPVDNEATNEWICSPANDIKAVSILNPPTGGSAGRSEIAVASPVALRFRNLGTQSQTNVPITAVIKDPNGNVEYRDTVIIPNWPSGPLGGNSDGVLDYSSSGQGPGKGAYYDTTFTDWTPPELGSHTVCGIAIMVSDQLRGDDTICGPTLVLPEDDAAAIAIENPQPDQEEPFGTAWQPAALFQSVGVADLFDVKVEVNIYRCSDGAKVFKADSSIPELNVDQGQVLFYFPTKQLPYDVSTLPPGCYTLCAIAEYTNDGNHSNDTACSQFSIIPRLSGNIYVGVGQRFQTIHAAVDSMRFRGIGGNLNLILTDSSYTENGSYRVSSHRADLDFTGISGLSKNSVVTWEPYPGQTPHIYFTGNKPACMYFGDLFGGFMTFEGYNPLGVPIADKVIAEPLKRGITITNQMTVPGPIFDIEEGASNITMKDLILHGSGNFANDSSSVVRLLNLQNNTVFLSLVHDTVPINNINVNNCEIGNAKIGIRDIGLHDQFNNGMAKFIVWRNNSNVFTRNTIGTAANPLSFAGIEFNNEQDFTISHNEISNINTTLAGSTGLTWNAFGIVEPSPLQYTAGVPNPIVPGDTGNVVRCWINANRVRQVQAQTGGAYGIALQQSVTIYAASSNPGALTSTLPILTQNRITNNMILDLYSKSTAYPILLNTAGVQYSTDGDSVFNNSISTSNATTNITEQYAKHVFLWNNILQNTGAGPYVNYALQVPRPYASAVSSDYNLFDLRGTNTFATVTEYDARYGTQFQVKTFRRLNDWQSYLQQDIHSLTGDPLFASPSMGPNMPDSLHMPPALTYIESPAFANGIWLGTYSQKYDFDGDQRLTGTLTPSIGADEWDGFQYTNDLAVQAITLPAGFSATSDTTLITTENPLWVNATVKNLSSQSIFNRSVTAMLEVAISGGPYTTIFDSSTAPMSWNAGQSLNVIFKGPVLTPQQAANGVFRLTVSVPNDQLNSNNVKQKLFSVLLKTQAVLVCYNGASGVGSAGLMNRDSVTQALTRLGVKYDLMDRNAPDGLINTTAIDYTPWWTIVWCTGTPTTAPVSGQPVGQGGLTFKETTELENFLKAGQTYAKKSLVVAGQNVAFYNGFVMPNNNVTDTEWLQTYMHTKYVATTPVSGTYNGTILGQQPIFQRFTESINCPSADVVKPSFTTALVGPEVTGFAYSYATHPLTPNDSGAGTTYYNTLTNTVFYGFDWSNPVQTKPGGFGDTTSGTTRILAAALGFIASHNGTILPVEFVTASGLRTNANAAMLNWSVADQNNIANYNIEQKQTDASWLQGGSAIAMDNTTSYRFNVGGLDAAQSYTYRIAAVDKDGAKTYSNEIQIGLPDDASIGFSLGQNYPNPSTGMTDVQYTLPVASTVTIRVLDVTGKEVYTPLLNVAQDAGTQTTSLDLSNFASGTYVYQLVATGSDGQSVTLSKKLTLEKQ